MITTNQTLFVQKSSLQILMSLQKHLSTSVSKNAGPQWHVSHFKQIVHGLLLCPPSTRKTSHSKRKKGEEDISSEDRNVDGEVRGLFIDSWLSECDDVRWFFLREAA